MFTLNTESALSCMACGAVFPSDESLASHPCSGLPSVETGLLSPMSRHHMDVELYWDIENVSLPRKVSAFFLVQGLKDFLANKGVIARKQSKTAIHLYYRAASSLSVKALENLGKADVDLICVPGRKPEAVDLKLQNSIYHTLETKESSTATIVLLSSDYDFLGVLRSAFLKGFRVVLIHNTLPPEQHASYSSCTHAMFLWSDVVAHVREKYPSAADPPSPSPSPDRDVVVTNGSAGAAAARDSPAPVHVTVHTPTANAVMTVPAPLAVFPPSTLSAAYPLPSNLLLFPPVDGKKKKKPKPKQAPAAAAVHGAGGVVSHPPGADAESTPVQTAASTTSPATTATSTATAAAGPSTSASKKEHTIPCWHFMRKGSCRFASSCKFLHPTAPRSEPQSGASVVGQASVVIIPQQDVPPEAAAAALASTPLLAGPQDDGEDEVIVFKPKAAAV